jgi:hypothetical protein
MSTKIPIGLEELIGVQGVCAKCAEDLNVHSFILVAPGSPPGAIMPLRCPNCKTPTVLAEQKLVEKPESKIIKPKIVLPGEI